MSVRAVKPVAAPVVVSDQTSLDVLGMGPRQFRALIVERAIPHTTWKRHVFARLDDLLEALGLVAPTASPRGSWSEDDVVARAAGGRRA